MVEIETIVEKFKEGVSKEVKLKEMGIGRYLIKTPFIFDDGDMIKVVLVYDSTSKQWRITDEGHTFLHLSYFMDTKDLEKGSREEILSNCKKMFSIIEERGELSIVVTDDYFGEALYNILQCILKIMDITYLERDRVKSTFYEDFRKDILKISKAKGYEAEFDYYVPEDKKQHFKIDCKIQTRTHKVFVFAINSDLKCREAMISILSLEKKQTFASVGIFEDQTEIGKKVLARFSDICEKQISSLDSIERFDKFLETHS